MAKNTGLWRLVYEEIICMPIYWPEQEKSEYDIGMRSVFQCRKCGFKKTFIHRKSREPNRDHYFCPGCGEAVMTKEESDLCI